MIGARTIVSPLVNVLPMLVLAAMLPDGDDCGGAAAAGHGP